MQMIDESKDRVKKILCKRLRAARVAANITSEQASKHIKQKNSTQVSLFESGKRDPSWFVLRTLALLYSVPVDYLLNITDDPIAEPIETNQAVIVHTVAKSISSLFETIVNKISQYTAIAVMGQRGDRVDLFDSAKLADELLDLLFLLKEKNGERWEDLIYGAKLERLILQIHEKTRHVKARMDHEEALRQEIERIDMVMDINAYHPAHQILLNLHL